MASKSNIEWTGHTWNPVAGCSVLTPGCTNCYAMKMAARLEAMGQPLYAGLTKPSKAGAVWTGVLRRAPDSVLLAPLKRKKPTTYFVNSMSDLFHEGCSTFWITKVLAVMAMTPHHTYQVLTKRAGIMRAFMSDVSRRNEVELAAEHIKPSVGTPFSPRYTFAWPLPNVWLGISAERQQEANERIPHLLQTPAAVRFVSAEPLLGPIDFSNIGTSSGGNSAEKNALTGDLWVPGCGSISSKTFRGGKRLDWIIVGGESGREARPFNIEWADQIVAQCASADVACFVKQLGSAPLSDGYPMHLKSGKGGDWNEWPDRLRVRQFPTPRLRAAA